MIDHEFRIITPVLRELIKTKNMREKTLIKKIPNFVLKNNYIETANKKYLTGAKLIKKVFFRGLPINNKKNILIKKYNLKKIFLK